LAGSLSRAIFCISRFCGAGSTSSATIASSSFWRLNSRMVLKKRRPQTKSVQLKGMNEVQKTERTYQNFGS
jgi:hypothetical protein